MKECLLKGERIYLDAFLPYRLNILAEIVSQGLARLYSQRFGISVAEWRVIATLADGCQMTARDIGLRTHMHKTKVSRAVSDLLMRGLIDRHENEADRREAFVRLSAQGRDVYEVIAPLGLAYQRRLVEGISEADMAAFTRIEAHLSSVALKAQEEISEADFDAAGDMNDNDEET